VAILGAGFSGLCMAIQLKRAGRNDFVVYEAGEGPSAAACMHAVCLSNSPCSGVEPGHCSYPMLQQQHHSQQPQHAAEAT
jgi:cation diffusion facilitator CzcD-associated flavoprotein CzcO